MSSGRACPEGGVHIQASHLGAEFVLKNFPGMAERCRQFGYDLARGRVPISPTAHFVMGGAAVDLNGQTSLDRLFVAGEDAGGVHGANRLGGNGICESCVLGRQVGKALAKHLSPANRSFDATRTGQADEIVDRLTQPMNRASGASPFDLKKQIQELNWNQVGVVRDGPGLDSALAEIDAIAGEASSMRVTGGRVYNMMYTTAVDLLNMIDVSRMVATSALARQETRGAHSRSDFPDQRDEYGLFNSYLRCGADGKPHIEKKPVVFSRKSLDECRQFRKDKPPMVLQA
jgi:succinate dehydrogenase / fumarate reductase flavoprotein subunit/fumarate reductase flavoprotein subunit